MKRETALTFRGWQRGLPPDVYISLVDNDHGTTRLTLFSDRQNEPDILVGSFWQGSDSWRKCTLSDLLINNDGDLVFVPLAAAGYALSPAIDNGYPVELLRGNIGLTLPAGCTFNFQIKNATTAAGLGAAGWSTFSFNGADLSAMLPRQWMQFKINLTRPGAEVVKVHSFKIRYEGHVFEPLISNYGSFGARVMGGTGIAQTSYHPRFQNLKGGFSKFIAQTSMENIEGQKCNIVVSPGGAGAADYRSVFGGTVKRITTGEIGSLEISSNKELDKKFPRLKSNAFGRNTNEYIPTPFGIFTDILRHNLSSPIIKDGRVELSFSGVVMESEAVEEVYRFIWSVSGNVFEVFDSADWQASNMSLGTKYTFIDDQSGSSLERFTITTDVVESGTSMFLSEGDYFTLTVLNKPQCPAVRIDTRRINKAEPDAVQPDGIENTIWACSQWVVGLIDSFWGRGKSGWFPVNSANRDEYLGANYNGLYIAYVDVTKFFVIKPPEYVGVKVATINHMPATPGTGDPDGISITGVPTVPGNVFEFIVTNDVTDKFKWRVNGEEWSEETAMGTVALRDGLSVVWVTGGHVDDDQFSVATVAKTAYHCSETAGDLRTSSLAGGNPTKGDLAYTVELTTYGNALDDYESKIRWTVDDETEESDEILIGTEGSKNWIKMAHGVEAMLEVKSTFTVNRTFTFTTIKHNNLEVRTVDGYTGTADKILNVQIATSGNYRYRWDGAAWGGEVGITALEWVSAGNGVEFRLHSATANEAGDMWRVECKQEEILEGRWGGEGIQLEGYTPVIPAEISRAMMSWAPGVSFLLTTDKIETKAFVAVEAHHESLGLSFRGQLPPREMSYKDVCLEILRHIADIETTEGVVRPVTMDPTPLDDGQDTLDEIHWRDMLQQPFHETTPLDSLQNSYWILGGDAFHVNEPEYLIHAKDDISITRYGERDGHNVSEKSPIRMPYAANEGVVKAVGINLAAYYGYITNYFTLYPADFRYILLQIGDKHIKFTAPLPPNPTSRTVGIYSQQVRILGRRPDMHGRLTQLVCEVRGDFNSVFGDIPLADPDSLIWDKISDFWAVDVWGS